MSAVRQQVIACERALKAAEQQLSELETALPKAHMEATSDKAKAADIEQRLKELTKATEVGGGGGQGFKELTKGNRGKGGAQGHVGRGRQSQGEPSPCPLYSQALTLPPLLPSPHLAPSTPKPSPCPLYSQALTLPPHPKPIRCPLLGPQVSADDAGRLRELESELQREERSLAGLKQQTAGLEKQVAGLQHKIDNAGKGGGGDGWSGN